MANGLAVKRLVSPRTCDAIFTLLPPWYSASPMIRVALSVVLALWTFALTAAHGQAAISADLARQLDAQLAELHEPDGCELERIDTQLATLTIGLKDSGGTEHSMVLSTSGAGAGPRRVGDWYVSIPEPLLSRCGPSVVAIERALLALAPPAPAASESTGSIRPELPVAMDAGDIEVRVIQLGWVLLILAGPWLCWRTALAVGRSGAHGLLLAALAIAMALGAVWSRGNEPLHANGHAWREAREVLIPWGIRGHGLAPGMHGKGAIALQWLLAATERAVSGSIDPFRISRVTGAAAAAGTGMLALVMTGSTAAGIAAAALLALLPVAQSLMLSGSSLAIAAWILPWSLALYLAAARTGERSLLAGAVLAAALGTLSHTAMLAWAPALVAAWLLVACREVRFSLAALAALLVLATAWILQFENAYAMLVSRNEGPGLLALSKLGFYSRNLYLDPAWFSPALPALLALWVIASLRRRALAQMLATLLVTGAVAVPLFAVNSSSSDAVRYQGSLLGLLLAYATTGLWLVPFPRWFGKAGAYALRGLGLIAVVALPVEHQPLDPAAVEHQLVEEAVKRIQPGTLIVLPGERFGGGLIIPDFPDFLLPPGSRVVIYPDPQIAQHHGPVLYYLGLACLSWLPDDDLNSPPEEGKSLWDMRPDCRQLREHSTPWQTRSLEALPRGGNVDAWTFHRLATGTPFGFFSPIS